MTAPAAPNVCLSCGYDLTGLPDSGLCPECAFPIARSRERSAFLRTADPAWLARIHRGLLDYTWSATTLLGCFIGGIALALTFEAIAPTGDRIGPWLVRGLPLVMLAAATLLHVGACMRLSAGTHGGFSRSTTVRGLLRTAGLLAPLYVVYTATGLAQSVGSPVVAAILHGAFQFTAFAFLFSLAAVLRGLESRTPAWTPALRRRHTNVRKNLIGLLIILALAYWLPVIRSGRPTAGARDGGVSLFVIAYVLMASAVSRVRGAVADELAAANAGSAPR